MYYGTSISRTTLSYPSWKPVAHRDMQFLARISNRLMSGRPLTGNQTKLWKASCGLLRSSLLSNDCHMFYSRVELATAVCCEVVVAGRKKAFCSLLELFDFGTVKTNLKKTSRKEASQPRVGVHTVTRFRNCASVVYVDLFSMKVGREFMSVQLLPLLLSMLINR